MATFIKHPLPISGALAEEVGITATDLDIRDLTSASDSVTIEGGNSADVNVSGVFSDGGDSITVDAVNLDIRDLSMLTDSIEVSGSVTGDMLHDHPNVEIITGKYTSAQTDTVLKAIGADERWITTGIAVFCAGNNVVDCAALIEYDDAADVRIAEHPGIIAGSGFTWGNGGGILAIGGDAQDLLFTSTPTVSGSVVVQVTGFVIES